MTTPQTPDISERPLAPDVLSALRYYLGGRRGFIVLAGIALAGGLWLGWPSLVAAGLAPIIFALAPCAVMCAVGLCMNKMSGSSRRAKSTSVSSSGPHSLAAGSDSPDGGIQSAASSEESDCCSPQRKETFHV